MRMFRDFACYPHPDIDSMLIFRVAFHNGEKHWIAGNPNSGVTVTVAADLADELELFGEPIARCRVSMFPALFEAIYEIVTGQMDYRPARGVGA